MHSESAIALRARVVRDGWLEADVGHGLVAPRPAGRRRPFAQRPSVHKLMSCTGHIGGAWCASAPARYANAADLQLPSQSSEWPLGEPHLRKCALAQYHLPPTVTFKQFSTRHCRTPGTKGTKVASFVEGFTDRFTSCKQTVATDPCRLAPSAIRAPW